MKQQTVALVSIGQSPRPDIAGDFTLLCNQAFTLLDIGALDDVSPEEIASLAPAHGESDLITKTRDGQVVYLSHDRLEPYMEIALAKAAKQGADWAVISCTGDFSRLHSSIPVLMPNQILAHSVASVLKQEDKLILIVPTEGQAGEATKRWEKRGYIVARVLVESPFGDHHALFELLQHDQVAREAQAVIADCFGFDVGFKNSVAKVYPKPVFVSRNLIAHLLLSVC